MKFTVLLCRLPVNVLNDKPFFRKSIKFDMSFLWSKCYTEPIRIRIKLAQLLQCSHITKFYQNLFISIWYKICGQTNRQTVGYHLPFMRSFGALCAKQLITSVSNLRDYILFTLESLLLEKIVYIILQTRVIWQASMDKKKRMTP